MEEAMKTQGEIEAEVSSGLSKLLSTSFGRGPRNVRSTLIPFGLVIMVENILTKAEAQLVSLDSSAKLFRDMRDSMLSLYKINIEQIVEEATGSEVNNVHHDISIQDGEESFVFSLKSQPECRVKKAV
jgi:uncharacterized protein YbcI